MRKFDATTSLFPVAGAGAAAAPATGIERSRGMLQHRSSDLARVMAERRESDARQSEHDDDIVAVHDATTLLHRNAPGSTLEEVSDASVSSVRSSDVSNDSDSHGIDEDASSSMSAATVRPATLYSTDGGDDDDIATMDIALVRERLAALAHASSPTQAEIDAMLAQYSDYASSSSSQRSSRSSSVSGNDNDHKGVHDVAAGSDTTNRTQLHHAHLHDVPAHETVIMKVLVVGNARCGKTSTIRQFVSREFSETYVSTIGADFVEKTMRYDESLMVSLQLWDIAGQDRFAKLTRAYFRDAAGALIVCDITRENTVDAVETWKHELDTCARDLVRRAPDADDEEETPLPVVMVANKSDLLTDVASALSIGVNMQKCVAKLGILEWFRTSAKRGDSVDDAFACLLDRMVANHRAAKAQQLRRAHEAQMHNGNDSEDDDYENERSYKHRGSGDSDHRVIRLTQLPPLSYDNTGGFGCDCN